MPAALFKWIVLVNPLLTPGSLIIGVRLRVGGGGSGDQGAPGWCGAGLNLEAPARKCAETTSGYRPLIERLR